MTKKVLLVDDVTMFIDLERDYLQLSAVKILTAGNGKDALEICRAERPAVVFMDLHMPVMNGADCCRAIKKDPQLRSTSVVLITSEGKDADRQICIQAGCDDFITKPLDRHIFLESARRLLPAVDRRDRRVRCRLKAKYRAFGITLSGFLVNLSLNGAYLATDAELEKDSCIDLIFALPEPNGTIVQTRGRVAWVNGKKERRKPSLPDGFGVEFLSPPGEALAAVTGYLEGELG